MVVLQASNADYQEMVDLANRILGRTTIATSALDLRLAKIVSRVVGGFSGPPIEDFPFPPPPEAT